MIKPPEHPLGPAFEKAREWAAEQERRLTDEQRRVFEAQKHRQRIERQRQQERLETVRKQLDEKARKRQPKPELSLTPPVLVADPYVRRQARYIIAGEKRLAQLDRRHDVERIETLKRFESDRAREEQERSGRNLAASWQAALQKTAKQEHARDRDRDIDRAK